MGNAGKEDTMQRPYDPEFDSPEARANFATRHIMNLVERRRKRVELLRAFQEEEVTRGIRPNYFASPPTREQAVLRKIKGNVRRNIVEKLLRTKNLNMLPPDLFAHEASDEVKEYLGAQHPAARGGEDLPNLLDGEVEIARLSLVDSVHGEVTSLRARLDASDNKLHLRLVDEYETEYSIPTPSVDYPLAAFEVLELFRDSTPSPLATSCETVFASDFYPELQQFAARMNIVMNNGS